MVSPKVSEIRAARAEKFLRLYHNELYGSETRGDIDLVAGILLADLMCLFSCENKSWKDLLYDAKVEYFRVIDGRA